MPVGIIRVGINDELKKQYLQMDAWTPLMAAFLVCGIEPPKDCDAMSDDVLKSCSMMSGPISRARDIVALWKSQQGVRSLVAPSDFVIWCLRNNIETSGLGDYIQNSGKIPPYLLDSLIKTDSSFYAATSSSQQQKTVSDELSSTASAKGQVESDRSVSRQHLPMSAGKMQRSSVLDPNIEKAIEEVGLYASAVFQLLHKQALDEVSPFDGVDGAKILYTDDGVKKTLTKKMLANRFTRRRKKQS